jgi:hypothetical protein
MLRAAARIEEPVAARIRLNANIRDLAAMLRRTLRNITILLLILCAGVVAIAVKFCGGF